MIDLSIITFAVIAVLFEVVVYGVAVQRAQNNFSYHWSDSALSSAFDALFLKLLCLSFPRICRSVHSPRGTYAASFRMEGTGSGRTGRIVVVGCGFLFCVERVLDHVNSGQTEVCWRY